MSWLHIVLYEPEIPPNTGNVIRLCANTGAQLHLIQPLGFEIDDKRMRRAGLDYHEFTDVCVHENWDACRQHISDVIGHQPRVFALSTRGKQHCFETQFSPGDVLLFGPETRGLPQQLLDALPSENVLRIPLRPGNRSLNLSNAVAVVTFEAWRQQRFSGGA